MGCYTTSDFTDVVGKKSPYLRDADLGFFRERGLCMRYKEQMFRNASATMDGLLKEVGKDGKGELKASLG